MNPCFAIIDNNTLRSIALRNILWDIYDHVEIHQYATMEEFIKDSNRHFVHFFVSSEILFSQVDEFETLKKETTIVSEGGNDSLDKAGFRVLDCTLPEQEIVGNLLELQQTWHKSSSRKESCDITDCLSLREKDVLKLIVKGMINKEIADELKISTPTVIFHRNNICEKLKTRSIGKLTVYAVLSGIVELKDI